MHNKTFVWVALINKTSTPPAPLTKPIQAPQHHEQVEQKIHTHPSRDTHADVSMMSQQEKKKKINTIYTLVKNNTNSFYSTLSNPLLIHRLTAFLHIESSPHMSPRELSEWCRRMEKNGVWLLPLEILFCGRFGCSRGVCSLGRHD